MLTDIKPRQHIRNVTEVPDPDYPGTTMEVEYWNHIPGEGRCHCGQIVTLHGFTNTCDCGADYNMSGQELAPRSQWGEETGESASDIINHDYESDRDVDY